MEQGVEVKFQQYPENAKTILLSVRQWILDIIEQERLGELEETLKWGQPSYLVKNGSTIRMDWSPKDPDGVYIFFTCNTKLVDTFRELYSDTFIFQGNRAIVLPLDKPLPKEKLRHCLLLALNYHRLKTLPLLGA
ncbi:DUF1801 domain-containing protein [Shewanella nanhaiensis]|uniref:DUF1801 domain-containing protein n=1 Tax=Shewanella nanhaiensis TaxID=2864872 RepID=A0ABS7E5E8_9GAMM|nr:DUF1801 domain-containing protein [Shewanella nanhaiensis]MBW8184912.1 DUF1801 domain-containing protein [Shewanella nanhaiensis]